MGGETGAPRLRVAPQICVSSGECVRIAPEVFGQQKADGTVVLHTATPSPAMEPLVRRAVTACPSRAIALREREIAGSAVDHLEDHGGASAETLPVAGVKTD